MIGPPHVLEPGPPGPGFFEVAVVRSSSILCPIATTAP